QGSFGGVGITMLVNDKEQVLISGVYQDGPAAAAGVLPGDIILAVDGVSLGKVADANVAALKIRGEISTEVTLTLQRETVGNIDLTMVRDTVSAVSVKGELLPQLPGLAYIRISDFAENTADEFMEEYNRLLEDGAIKALIFDLRSNTGGSFYAALRIANYFIVNNGLIVTEKMGDKEQPYLSSSGVLANLPIVVLQNGYTASASEVLAGAIADYGHTVLVGSNSYGKGITQSLEPLPSGNGLRYTRGKYLTPSGFSLHGSGLKPDILVEDPPDATAQSYFSLDPSQNTHLAAAIEYLQKNVYN
ncbi:MAG: S41 family peptidase, partial [Clostridiales bacterium]